MRTNAFNTGKRFENMVSASAAHYQAEGLLRIKKVEPPTRIVGGGQARRVIFMENPFLDWVGAWTERRGRAVFIECKSTGEGKLPFDGNGVTTLQLDAMRNWSNAGAVAFVLWEWKDRIKVVPVSIFKAARDAVRIGQGFKHLKWDEVSDDLLATVYATKIPVDFLPAMRKVWP